MPTKNNHKMLKLLLRALLIPLTILISLIVVYLFKKITSPTPKSASNEPKSNDPETGNIKNDAEIDELIFFQGGEDLTVSDILDAPGEVIGKSSYGATLYKANLLNPNSGTTPSHLRKNSTFLLRFLRPICCGTHSEVISGVNAIGLIRHSNLVPLNAFYMGFRGEKLLVYPFYELGNLSQFIKDVNSEFRNWDTIYKIALGVVKGLAYLHSGLQKPIIHGNLKSKNILLGPDFLPYISDYGLYLLLNLNAEKEMLENSASQGYKAPELMKIKDACESTDVYSLGIVLLELLTSREPVSTNTSDSQEVYLPDAIRKAILDQRINDMYHPDIVFNLNGNVQYSTEDSVIKLVQLALSCCSPSPSLRPFANEVVRKVEELNK